MERKNIYLLIGLLGLVLIVLPRFAPIQFTRLAVVIYPEKFWYSLHPDGTKENPTLLSLGTQFELKAELVYYDAETVLSLHVAGHWLVYCTIDGTQIQLKFKEHRDGVEGRYATGVFTAMWTTPTEEGKLLSFEWLVIIREYVGDGQYEELGRVTTTTWGKTPLEEPDGYFTINGRRADQTTTLVVLDPGLTVEFIPTRKPEKITSVFCEIYYKESLIDTFYLSKDTTYKARYTLPHPGTFEIKGFFEWDGQPRVPKLSIAITWGEEPPALPILSITGALIAIVGFVMYAREIGVFGKK